MSTKGAVRDAVARLLFASRLTAPRRRGRARLSIATFHRVLPEAQRCAYPYPGLAVTPDELDAFLGYYASHFDCGPLARQHERHLCGERTAKPLLALTFDDGQHDNFAHARPLLLRHGLKASFFIPVEAVECREPLWHDRLGFALAPLLARPEGRAEALRVLRAHGYAPNGADGPSQAAVAFAKRLPLEARLALVEAMVDAAGRPAPPDYGRMMTFDELAQLAAEGHEIGSHSMTHCLMPECDDRRLAYETGESRRTLRSRLGQPVDSFCYPNGDADARSAAAVRAAGYRRAVTTAWGLNGDGADPYLLRRCDMDPAYAKDARGTFFPALVAFRMSGLYPGLH